MGVTFLAFCVRSFALVAVRKMGLEEDGGRSSLGIFADILMVEMRAVRRREQV